MPTSAVGRTPLRWPFAPQEPGAPRPLAVGQPVLVQWGERDHALIPQLAEPPRDLVPDATTIRYPDAGHWVHLDEAEAVNDQLLRFLAN